MLSENCFETYEQSRISRTPRRDSLNPVWIRVQQRMGGSSLPIRFLSKLRILLKYRSLPGPQKVGELCKSLRFPGARKIAELRVKAVFVCLLLTGLLCAALLLGGCSRRAQEPVLELTPETVQTEDARTEVSNSSMAYGAHDSSVTGVSSEERLTVTVHVCGAVQNEGVYTLPAGSLVRDALEAAGGFSADADTTYINLAAELQNASQIRFPTKEETSALRAGADPSALYGEGAAPASGEEPDTQGKINLNTASKEELMRIPGIGESKAQRILDYREQNGGFQKIEDLMKVPGIKDASFQKMKDYVTI